MILLDTHVWVWLLQGDDRLGERARTLIEQVYEDRGDILISAISPWEIALMGRKRAALAYPPQEWVAKGLALPGIMLAPLEPDIAIKSVDLIWSHRDPADRIIVATADHREARLLTADEKILAYADTGRVQAIDARV